MSAALAQTLQFFGAQKSYAKKVLFVLSTGTHIASHVAEALKVIDNARL